jgi:asparagine synthase (glutamine-hydrolysing)
VMQSRNGLQMQDALYHFMNSDDLACLGLPVVVKPFETTVTPNRLNAILQWDITHFLAESICTKVDRASMAVGLEVREPLLDHRLLEHAMQLPEEKRISKTQGKVILRQILEQEVPSHISQRRKQAFAPPIDHWLNTVMKSESKAIIFSEPMIQFFGKDALKKWWYHVHHNEYHPRKVWHMMVLGSWMK